MLSVWIDFELKMRGLTMRVSALANVHVKTTTRPTFKLARVMLFTHGRAYIEIFIMMAQ